MGVDYYLVSHDHEEMCMLGRGYWHQLSEQPSIEELRDIALNIALDRDASTSEARRATNKLIQWVEAHGLPVSVMSDAEEAFAEMRDYTVTGDFTDCETMSPEDVQKDIEKAAEFLRDELGADDVRITVRLEKTPLLDNPDELLIWEHVRVLGFDTRMSGYRLMRVPTKRPTDE